MNNPAASGRGIKFFFTRNLLTPQSDGVFTLLIQIKTQEENGGAKRRHSLLGFYLLIRLETEVFRHNHIQIFYIQQIHQDAHRHKLGCN
ncbi:MAG: hypothetical protein ACK5QY_08425, partial [Pseudanabaena sp.]